MIELSSLTASEQRYFSGIFQKYDANGGDEEDELAMNAHLVAAASYLNMALVVKQMPELVPLNCCSSLFGYLATSIICDAMGQQ
jgi:hypothetical protein